MGLDIIRFNTVECTDLNFFRVNFKIITVQYFNERKLFIITFHRSDFLRFLIFF